MISIQPFRRQIGTRTLCLPQALKVEPGQVLWVTGPSGIGKTTFLEEVARQLTKKRLAVLFQDHPLTGPLRPEVNAALGAFRDHPWWKTLFGVPTSLRGVAVPLLREMGLTEFDRAESKSLSGGEKQRCLLVRAILSNPEVLVADEPTSQLDHETGRRCLELLAQHLKNATILISNHDPESMMAIPHRKLDLQTQGEEVIVRETR